MADFGDSLLMVSLEAAVPLWILEFRDQPSDKLGQLVAGCGEFIAAHGDDLLFGGEHCGDAFNALAKSLAVLAFAPGGVTFNGRHWEYPPVEDITQPRSRSLLDVAIPDQV